MTDFLIERISHDRQKASFPFGGNRKYIFYTVALMVLGMLASVTVTASLCKAISLAAEYNVNSGGPIIFLSPALAAVAGILVRYAASVLSGNLKDTLGRRAKKELRQQVYDKIVRLGVRSTDGMSMAGLTQVAMVSQSTYLFDETIEENLRMAKPDATQEELEWACAMASVHDFILTLPQGYQTRVWALGDNLSAGEKQRIGLARAFLRGSELILLDEPTSNVDSINEGIILKALKEQKNRKAIILVSHRESTMSIADRVYHIQGGRIVEQA